MDNTAKKIEELEAKCSVLEHEKSELRAEVNWYREQLRLDKARRFAKSSEQIGPEQVQLFNEAEAEAKPSAPEPAMEEITYKRRKQKGKRDEQLKDLPVETIEYRLSPEEQICTTCNCDLHEMSQEIRREIKIIPAQTIEVRHVTYIYSCRRCEKEGESSTIVTAQAPAPVLPGSIASPSAVSHIMTQKYADAMPLYRQEKALARQGVELSRQTMANWVIQCSQRWLEPLYELMHEQLLQEKILFADETPLQVLREPDRPASSKSYMWLYRNGGDRPANILYDYRTTRASKHPIAFLNGFGGYLHVDGYGGYDSIPEVTLVGCFAHARRKYTNALKALPDENSDAAVVAKEGLAFCNQLFSLEREFKNLTPEDRYRMRLIRSRPVLDKFYEWLNYQRPRVLPKSSFGTAINYCLKQGEKLQAFLLDGRLELDNNRAERSIKPFVIGRKNYLFSNTPRGAKASATVYSLIESAKENGLNPFEYLKYLFEKMPNADLQDKDQLKDLLPWSNTLPAELQIKK